MCTQPSPSNKPAAQAKCRGLASYEPRGLDFSAGVIFFAFLRLCVVLDKFSVSKLVRFVLLSSNTVSVDAKKLQCAEQENTHDQNPTQRARQ